MNDDPRLTPDPAGTLAALACLFLLVAVVGAILLSSQ